MWIQTGPEAGDGFNLSMGFATAESLGLEDLDLTTEEGATDAIDTVSDALMTVNRFRSIIGAQQNRLEHAYNNNMNATENTEASESRIRDTDMPAAMAEYAKQSILEQVAVAILAQANQSNNYVLKLLE